MKIKNRSQKKPLIIALVVFLVVLAAGVGAYSLYDKNTSDNNSSKDSTSRDSSSDSTDDAPSGDNEDSALPNKQQPSDDTSPDTDTTGDPATDLPDDDTPVAQIETPSIERASQSGNSIRIVATLQQNSSGSCNASLTRAGSSTVKVSSTVVVGPSYYTCSFSIPSSRFDAAGDWNLQVSHVRGSSVATSPIQTVTVTKG